MMRVFRLILVFILVAVSGICCPEAVYADNDGFSAAFHFAPAESPTAAQASASPQETPQGENLQTILLVCTGAMLLLLAAALVASSSLKGAGRR